MAINWQLVDPDLHDSLEWAHSKLAAARGSKPENIYILQVRDSKKFDHIAMQYLEEDKWEHWMILRTHKQEIKRTWSEILELIRPLIGDRTVMEVYPRECDTVNTINARHFWVISDGMRNEFDLRTIE